MNQPWVEVNLPYGADWWDVNDPEEGQCFVLTYGELQPGMLVETEKAIELVGHINKRRGRCDCCANIYSDTLIKRFKIIWQEEEAQ